MTTESTPSELEAELEWAAGEAMAMARSSVAMGLVNQVSVYQEWYERLAARAAHVKRLRERADRLDEHQPEEGSRYHWARGFMGAVEALAGPLPPPSTAKETVK